MPNDETNIRILDYRAEKIRSAIRRAYYDYREAVNRAMSDFKAAADEISAEIRGLDTELERTFLSYAERHDSDYLLRRVLEGRAKQKAEQERKTIDDEPQSQCSVDENTARDRI
jgi:hypothetical protein